MVLIRCIQTNTIKEVPTRLEKDKVKEFAQLEERYQVSACAAVVVIMHLETRISIMPTAVPPS